MPSDVSVSSLPGWPGPAKFAAIFAVVLTCLLLSACRTAKPVVEVAPPAPAQLSVLNLSDYRWQVVITRVTGEEVRDETIAPRAKLVFTLPAGDYLIEQTALDGAKDTALTRKLPARFAAGQNYRWRLGTLLSETQTSSQ